MTQLTVEHRETANGTPVTLLLLNRPDRHNALSLELVESLQLALSENADSLAILGSTSGGTFCGGADLRVSDEERTQLSDRLYACYRVAIERPGPLIAAIDGPAVGGGAQLASVADIRIASSRARWRWVGPGHGLAVGAWIVPTLLGRSRGLDLTLTGRWLTSEEALGSGFIRSLEDDPLHAAIELADTLSSSSPAALARVKQISIHADLLASLSEEREQNRRSWNGSAPTLAPSNESSRNAPSASSATS